MFDTSLTVIGRLVNAPVLRRVGDAQVANFRLASNSRRRTPDGTWEQGNSLFLNVSCWGNLGIGVAASLAKGDAVVVTGFVYTSEYDDRDGNRRSSLEMRAHAVGPDLAYYVVKVGRVVDNEQPDAEVYQDERLSDAAAVDLLDEPEPLPV
ncbi:single-stranded DNA-binding protein [Mycolicibacterium chitae]|uniref:Single-stranded DNA-binding protein n=1 Tax=Mycolicibacterium chitae TaxID=1792 RepID=A0A448I461_MYCCI|nr:single-stranded DNA-binding protein [Mycolicibacterium chitae]MCV7108927.1 single-stranded DNA-binding protein [Mycolicibacterium chitae]BBZ03614.1 single-stranded DNA-binding protein [Mycolicibacterium chitae]VEG47269.1 Helix-destabilizing protein [Mycolicibacterium chitae]